MRAVQRTSTASSTCRGWHIRACLAAALGPLADALPSAAVLKGKLSPQVADEEEIKSAVEAFTSLALRDKEALAKSELVADDAIDSEEDEEFPFVLAANSEETELEKWQALFLYIQVVHLCYLFYKGFQTLWHIGGFVRRRRAGHRRMREAQARLLDDVVPPVA